MHEQPTNETVAVRNWSATHLPRKVLLLGTGCHERPPSCARLRLPNSGQRSRNTACNCT